MTFDPMPHLIKLIVIRCGQLLFPEEKDVTKLYKETLEKLGLNFYSTPLPSFFPDPPTSPVPPIGTGPPLIPPIECPTCKKISFFLHPLCRTCKEAEAGKYKTIFRCSECSFSEKSEKALVVWLREKNIPFPTGTKVSLGIKTLTDEGLK